MEVTLESGARYEAVVLLTGLESLASQGQVESTFTDLGFDEVAAVPISDRPTRWEVAGRWAGEDRQTVEVPEQVQTWKRVD